MPIPLKYNVRNLMVRKISTGMTVFVISLVVTVFLFVLSLWSDPMTDVERTRSRSRITSWASVWWPHRCMR